jgi:hypothetical protein
MGKIKQAIELIELIERTHNIKFYLYQKIILTRLIISNDIIETWHHQRGVIMNKNMNRKGRM